MALTPGELQEKYETLRDPGTGREFKLPEQVKEREYFCTSGLQLKDIQTGDVHDLPKSGIPIFLGGKYFAPERGEFPRARAYTIPIPDVKKSAGGILKHPQGHWCIYPIGEIYLDGLLVDEIKPLDKDFSKIQAGGKDFRVLHKYSKN